MLDARFNGVEEGLDLEQPQAGTVGFESGKMRAQFGVSDQDLNAGVSEDKFEFFGLEEVVDGHDDGAGVQYAEQCRNELGTVLQPQADTVAGFDLEFLAQLV